MRWSEEIGLYQHVGFLDVGKVSLRLIGQGRDMIHGMIAEAMSSRLDLLKDGTIAGSCADLMQCVKTAISFGVPFDDAVKRASETPANLLKLNKGKIAVGYDADILVVDDELNIEKVIISGNEFEK